MAKPGKWLYAVALVIAAGGSSASVWRGCAGSMDSIRSMDRRVMPGTGSYDLPAGRHQVFVETTSQVDGRAVGDGSELDVSCAVDGSELQNPTLHETYNLGGFSGELAWELELEAPATVTLTCTSQPDGVFVIAIGEGFTVSDLLLAIVGFTASILVGLALFFFTFIRRRSSRDGPATAPIG